MVDVVMPKFGATMTSGQVSEWHVKAGDHFQKGDDLCEVSTDKITNTVTALMDGTVREIVVEEGDDADVGAVICTVEED